MDKKIVLITGLLLYSISGYFSYAYFSETGNTQLVRPAQEYAPPQNGGTSPKELSGPKTEECPLNGQYLTKGHKILWEKRRPLGVMIENHTDARPQSGLSSADVVYEAVAEGGITRFLAIFYCKDAHFIGPVRSARVYFIDMLRGYGEHPLYAHVGGANTSGPADALGNIRKFGWDSYNDMNQFSIPFPYYYRDYERNPGVATEHTMYSSTQKLWKYAKEKRKLTQVDEDGMKWNKGFDPWSFKDDSEQKGDITSISFDFWENKKPFSVSWKYNAQTNTYSRTHGDGNPHIDKNTGKQLQAKNVVTVFMKEFPANDGYKGGHLLYKTTGTGKAFVFQDGIVIEGRWSKQKPESSLRVLDNSGKEVSFNRGLIWVAIVPEGNIVSY